MTSVWIKTDSENYDIEPEYVDAEKFESCLVYYSSEPLVKVTTIDEGYSIYKLDDDNKYNVGE
ncbi:MAG: hypothetical protein K8R11_09720 [Methanococcoides sp.]|nr:hypothetical protein [Methanococcoides sp.]